VFFITTRALLPEDRDQTLDIYMWSTGGLRLISAGTRGNPPDNAEELHLRAISRDGRRVYFNTYEQLVLEDTDDKVDVYEWAEGAIRLVSPASGGRQTYAFFQGISPNGRYVAFSTLEPLLGSDTDSGEDIYITDMGPGVTALASAAAAKRTRHRAKRRVRLVTAEAIPPRMRIPRRGSFGARTARLRLGCPRSERSGPCRGRVRLLSRRTKKLLAVGKFRIRTGKRGKVLLTGKRLPKRKRSLVALVRVRGVDRLGNAAVVRKRILLRRAPTRTRRQSRR
jgi:hypothetical protein